MNQHPGVWIALAAGLLLTAACATGARTTSPETGRAPGRATATRSAVAVTFTWTGDHHEGSFDADALQVAGIPFAKVTGAGGRVHFELPGDETTAIFDEHASPASDRRQLRGRWRARHVQPGARGAAGRSRAPRGRQLPQRSGDPGRHRAVAHRAGPACGHRVPARLGARGAVGQPVPRDEVRRTRGGRADLRQARRRRLDRRLAVGRLRRARRRRSRGDPLAARARRRRPRADRHLRTQPGGDARAAGRRARCAARVHRRVGGGRDRPRRGRGLQRRQLDRALPAARRRARQARQSVDAIVDVAYRGGDRAALDALAAGLRDRAWHFEPPPPSHCYWAISNGIAGFIRRARGAA